MTCQLKRGEWEITLCGRSPYLLTMVPNILEWRSVTFCLKMEVFTGEGNISKEQDTKSDVAVETNTTNKRRKKRWLLYIQAPCMFTWGRAALHRLINSGLVEESARMHRATIRVNTDTPQSSFALRTWGKEEVTVYDEANHIEFVISLKHSLTLLTWTPGTHASSLWAFPNTGLINQRTKFKAHISSPVCSYLFTYPRGDTPICACLTSDKCLNSLVRLSKIFPQLAQDIGWRHDLRLSCWK